MKASAKRVCADDTQTFTKNPGTLPAHPIQHRPLLLLTGSRRGPHLPLPSASGGGPVILCFLGPNIPGDSRRSLPVP